MKALIAIILLATTISLAACDSSNVVDPGVAGTNTSLQTLQQELTLSNKVVSDLESILSNDGEVEMDKRAAQSWAAAKYLRENLSVDQKAKLTSLAETQSSGTRQQRTRRNGKGDRVRHQQRARVELTEAQRELVTAHRSSIKEMVAEFRSDGTLDEGEREQVRKKQDAFRSELMETFSPEQQAAISTRKTRRPQEQEGKAKRASRFDRATVYLDLSDDQTEKIEAIRAQRESIRDSFKEMEPEDRRAAIAAERKEAAALLDDILSAEQKELIEIHRGLTRALRANRKANR